MRTARNLCAFILAALLCAVACVAMAEAAVPFVRIDRDDPEAWRGDLDNVRLLKDDLFAFQKVKKKYGIDPAYTPDTSGLDTLCISGSAQFSAPQFKDLADRLRACAAGRTVYVIDLRQESHVLVNEGIPPLLVRLPQLGQRGHDGGGGGGRRGRALRRHDRHHSQRLCPGGRHADQRDADSHP